MFLYQCVWCSSFTWFILSVTCWTDTWMMSFVQKTETSAIVRLHANHSTSSHLSVSLENLVHVSAYLFFWPLKLAFFQEAKKKKYFDLKSGTVYWKVCQGKTINKTFMNVGILFFSFQKNIQGIWVTKFALQKTVNVDTRFSTDTEAASA